MHRDFITCIVLMLIFASLCTAGCLQATTPQPPSTIPATLTGTTREPTVVTQGTTSLPSTPVTPAGTAVNITINGTAAVPGLTGTVPSTTSTPASVATTKTTVVATPVAETSASPGSTLTTTVTPAPRGNATQTAIPAVNNILATLSGDPRFTILRTAIGAADIAGTLNGSGPFTIFAPTNDAFSSLPPGSVDTLLADPGGELKEILLYHIVPGKLTVQDLSGMKSLTTLQGEKLSVEVVNGTILVDEIEVIVPDIPASNGEIQGIGGVLIPSTL